MFDVICCRLSQDVTLIGRAKEKVQFFLDSLKHKGLISRIHARIFKCKSQTGQDVFKICDTSLNGTFVNDVKILNEALLKPGDSVSFGHLQGAVLQAGNRYSQPNSEFRFKVLYSINLTTDYKLLILVISLGLLFFKWTLCRFNNCNK